MEKTMTRGAVNSGITKDKLRAAIARLEEECEQMVIERRTPYEIQRKRKMLFEMRAILSRMEGRE